VTVPTHKSTVDLCVGIRRARRMKSGKRVCGRERAGSAADEICHTNNLIVPNYCQRILSGEARADTINYIESMSGSMSGASDE